MLDVIFAIKFVHMIAMAVLFGTWICIGLLMLFAYRSHNTSVVALTSVFVVRLEFSLMIGAIVLQPLAGYPLATAIGESIDEYWFEMSVAIYAIVAAAWLANFMIELRLRKMSQEAALKGFPLPESYRRMLYAWGAIWAVGLAAMIDIMRLMIWQPHWYAG